MNEFRQIAHNGLWKNNPALVQILGLCPLLAVSNTAINGLGLGLATMMVLTLSNLVVSSARQIIPKDIRIPVFVMVIASLVTTIELLMHAYTYTLYKTLGIFVPLIVTNCMIIGRAESFASRNPVLSATFDGLMQGAGFAGVLLLLGAVREVLGNGTLLDGAHHLFGDVAINWTVTIFPWQSPLLLAILPPGAFLVLGLFVAGKNALDARQSAKQKKRRAGESIPEGATA